VPLANVTLPPELAARWQETPAAHTGYLDTATGSRVQQMLVCTDGAAKGLLKILEERGETCQTWTQKP
jgi:hypothetical protein